MSAPTAAQGVCPHCRKTSTTKHCTNSGCPWKLCICTSTYVKYDTKNVVVFDQHGRGFIR